VDSDLRGSGTVRVWSHPETKRPVKVEWDMDGDGKNLMRFDEFKWDVPTDGWFDTAPPKRYADKTPAPPTVEEITELIVAGLRSYAKHGGGKYPPVKTVYGDRTTEELFGFVGLHPPSKPGGPNITNEQLPLYNECNTASRGFGWINHLQRYNADAVYNGKTVGPDDKGKVLVRWKLDGGEYRVIFGDLKAETVSAEKLKELEKK
jgi:hypothetical protein